MSGPLLTPPGESEPRGPGTTRDREEAWLAALIRTTQDALVSMNREGRIVLFNPAAERIFGYSRGEAIGQKVNMLMGEPYAGEHDHYVRRYEQGGEPHAIGRVRLVTARRKNGELFSIELSVTEIQEDDETRYAAFIRDVSERERTHERLARQERLALLGRLSATLAHEIGNPLNGLSLNLELLERSLAREGVSVSDRVRSVLGVLRAEIQRLDALLHEYRFLGSTKQMDVLPTSLPELVAEVFRTLALDEGGRDLRLTHRFPDDFPILRADPGRLKQVFMNLVRNAAESMPRGGTLSVQGRRHGERIVVEVRDTGSGVPEDLDIFQPFMTTKEEGTGLGLAIVQQIVAEHGGSVSYTSARGLGTTFRVELPLSLPRPD
jgi:two-component system, LuxR family, sensor kinase FixL